MRTPELQLQVKFPQRARNGPQGPRIHWEEALSPLVCSTWTGESCLTCRAWEEAPHGPRTLSKDFKRPRLENVYVSGASSQTSY